MTRALEFLIVILLVCVPAIAQDHSVLEPVPVLTLQEQLKEAGIWAAKHNRNYTVKIPESGIAHMFSVPLIIPPHVSLIGDGAGSRAARLGYNGPETDQPLINVVGNGYGAEIGGFEIALSDRSLPNVTALQIGGATKNAKVRDIRFEHFGKDTLGIVVQGHESLTVEHCEFRCTVPVVYEAGDNITFRDMDIGTATTEAARASMSSGRYPLTCVWIKKLPDHLLFEGSQTWQGGDHMIYARLENQTIFGSGLRIENVRWEQSLSKASTSKYAIDFRNAGPQRLEVFTVGSNVRFADRQRGIYVTGCWWLGLSESAWRTGTTYYKREPVATW